MNRRHDGGPRGASPRPPDNVAVRRNISTDDGVHETRRRVRIFRTVWRYMRKCGRANPVFNVPVADDPKPELVPPDADDLSTRTDEPPVVARLIVEIRSDGSHTIARGAVEDRTSGHKVGLEVEGTSMLSLARSLARALFEIPSMAAATRASERSDPPGLPGSSRSSGSSWRRGLRQRLGLRRSKG